MGATDSNVGDRERVASVVGGTALALYGLTRGSLGGALLALAGGGLVYRGATGSCSVYRALGVDTSDGDARPATSRDASGTVGQLGIKVDRTVTVAVTPEEAYAVWRDFEGLGRFMRNVESVKVIDATRSHWTVKAPAGSTVEWDAEIVNDEPNELIAWKSVEGADVDNAGSVNFTKAPNGRGTLVSVSLQYNPPAGRLGATVAWLTGDSPEWQVDEDLRRFKQLVETGEIPTTEGQPAGR